MKSKPAGYVIKRLKVFFKRMMKPYKEHGEEEPIIEKINNKKIEIRNDGLSYDLIYDPSMADYPSYRIQEKFDKLVEDMGWSLEHEGGGIITLYKGD